MSFDSDHEGSYASPAERAFSQASELPSALAQASPSATDYQLLQELGLKAWVCNLDEEVHVGDVMPFSGYQDHHDRTVVSLYVTAKPLTCWRFEIVHRNETTGKRQRQTITTGTANLKDVWASVLLVADGVIDVGLPVPLEKE